MIVDQSQKGDRLIPAALEIKVVLPHGCESSVSSTTKVAQSDLLWRCVTMNATAPGGTARDRVRLGRGIND
jgi:hypothetical protein